MKLTKIIFAVLIFIAMSFDLPAQTIFTIPFEIGQGFHFKDYHYPQWYSVNVSTKPTMAIDKFQFSAVVLAVTSDGRTDYFAGNAVGYKFYEKKDKTWNLQLSGSALFGTNERKLYGGGLILEKGDFYLSANVRQEYENKELWFDGSLGVKLATFK